MKKNKLLILPLSAALLIAGCGGGTEKNEAPEIVGAKDVDCVVYATVDLLDGVAALDREDGDLTPEMEITVSPAVAVNNGYAQFKEEGDYEVTYKITDSKGESAEEISFVTVYSRKIYQSVLNNNGFATAVKGGAVLQSDGITDSSYTFNVTGAQNAADAVLTRTYALNKATEYTFIYNVNSNLSGNVGVEIDGKEQPNVAVTEGDNELTFKYAVPDGEKDTANVKVDLKVGALGNDIKWRLDKVVTERPKDDGAQPVELLENFSFAGTYEGRFDNNGGEQTGAGVANAAEDGSSATVKITEAFTEIWRGGMFIKTGLKLTAGETYNVSFNLQATQSSSFEVKLLNRQWDGEATYHTAYINSQDDWHQNITITPNAGNVDGLVLYIQSGNNTNEITISDLSVKTMPETAGADGKVELAKNFSFAGKVHDRFDNNNGGESGAGNKTVAEDGSSATLNITEAFTAIWRGGMFIDTGIALQEGETYYVSFDLQSTQNTPYEVVLQHKQWGPDEVIHYYNTPVNGKNEVEITCNTSGSLWLYVQSGNNLNEITISNLSVKKDASNVVKDTYSFNTCTVSHDGDGAGTLKVENGKIIYTVEKFGTADWHNKISSPAFALEGTGMQYMVCFKAKATKPVKVVFAGPVANGWDPTFFWESFTIGTEEQVYAFKSNVDSVARLHQFVWQFGSSVNAQYDEEVVIEISDITVCERCILDL